MTFAPYGTKTVNLPGMPAMAEAFVEDVNASGGINGRELKLITCNEGDDPVGAADCADQAVEAGAVAVVGSYSQHGSSFMPGLEGAGIPFIGGYGISEEEFTSPLSYPVNGGVPALLAGNGRQLAEADCERVSIVRPDTATGDMLAIYLDAGLRAGKHPGATVDVQAAEDAKDYSSVAERALGDDPASSCVTAVLGKRTDTFLDSYVRLDPENARFSSVLGSIGQTTVDSTGGATGPLEGVHATGWYPPENDVSWNRMREAVDKYAPGGNRIDVSAPGEQTTWVAYTVFQAVARTLDPGDITADNVRRALDSHSGVSTGNLTPLLR